MKDRARAGGLSVASVQDDYVNDEALPGSEMQPAGSWLALEPIRQGVL